MKRAYIWERAECELSDATFRSTKDMVEHEKKIFFFEIHFFLYLHYPAEFGQNQKKVWGVTPKGGFGGRSDPLGWI